MEKPQEPQNFWPRRTDPWHDGQASNIGLPQPEQNLASSPLGALHDKQAIIEAFTKRDSV